MSGGWTANLRRRAISGIPAFLLVLVVVGFAPTFVISLVVLLLGVLSSVEFHRLLPARVRERLGAQPLILGSALLGLGALVLGLPGLNLMLFAAVVVVTAMIWLGPAGLSEEGVGLAGTALLGLLLIPWMLNHVGLIHGLPGGGGWVALLVTVVTLNDTLAYLVGSLLGTRPLVPRISPHKTVEGAVAGLAGGVVGSLIGFLWLLPFESGPGFFEALFLGGTLAVAAQAGDLLESKFKRLVGAEESGNFLPGHGGLLDRLDAYLLSTPLLYYYLYFQLELGAAGA
jgi:phosphatidate cytidylyltransferase